MKNLIVDLDGTITGGNTSDYKNALPQIDIIDKLKEYKAQGFNITIFTARNMRTHEGNVGKINVQTLPIIMDWLEKYDVPFDEILVGKPWCGTEGFYIDDRAIRPSEFSSLTHSEIAALLEKEKECS